jgi:hypothetical protein
MTSRGRSVTATAVYQHKRNWLIESLKMICPVRAASSTGRCNTIQCVDSTKLARESHLFGCARLKPRQGSVPARLTLASYFSFCFQCQAGSSLVLRRPIETTVLIRHLQRTAIDPGRNSPSTLLHSAASLDRSFRFSSNLLSNSAQHFFGRILFHNDFDCPDAHRE